MRTLLIALPLIFGSLAPAQAAVSVGIGINVPGVSIGINVPVYPHLVRVPGYPVYYDPQADSNYFFYDGLYWVYRDDNWYQSDWYNGPWQAAAPEMVPLFVLRVPVRYYRRPPVYFRGWIGSGPPHWGEHWGREWQERHDGWDRWDRRQHIVAAPLPSYQRQYSGDRYPREAEQQHAIRTQNYHYQSRDVVVKQHFEQRDQRGNAAPQGNPRADARPDSPPAQATGKPRERVNAPGGNAQAPTEPGRGNAADAKAARVEGKAEGKAAAQEKRQEDKDKDHPKN